MNHIMNHVNGRGPEGVRPRFSTWGHVKNQGTDPFLDHDYDFEESGRGMPRPYELAGWKTRRMDEMGDRNVPPPILNL